MEAGSDLPVSPNRKHFVHQTLRVCLRPLCASALSLDVDSFLGAGPHRCKADTKTATSMRVSNRNATAPNTDRYRLWSSELTAFSVCFPATSG